MSFTKSNRGAFARANRGAFGTGAAVADLNSAGVLSISNASFSLYAGASSAVFIETVSPTVYLLGEGLGDLMKRTISAGPGYDMDFGILDDKVPIYGASGWAGSHLHGASVATKFYGTNVNLMPEFHPGSIKKNLNVTAPSGTGPYTTSVEMRGPAYGEFIGRQQYANLRKTIVGLTYHFRTSPMTAALIAFDLGTTWDVGSNSGGLGYEWYVDGGFDMTLTTP